MIETRRASRIRPLGLALSSWRADTTSEGWEVLSQWQPSASVTTALMNAQGHQLTVGSTLESVGCDGRPSAHRRPARRGALPAPSLRPLPGKDVRPTAHDDGAAHGTRAGLPKRRRPPPPCPARASATQHPLTTPRRPNTPQGYIATRPARGRRSHRQPSVKRLEAARSLARSSQPCDDDRRARPA
jgi:hypothetical protein